MSVVSYNVGVNVHDITLATKMGLANSRVILKFYLKFKLTENKIARARNVDSMWNLKKWQK